MEEERPEKISNDDDSLLEQSELADDRVDGPTEATIGEGESSITEEHHSDDLKNESVKTEFQDDVHVEAEAQSCTPSTETPTLGTQPLRCDACSGKHVRHTCAKGGSRTPRSSSSASTPSTESFAKYTAEEFEGWHGFRKVQWRSLRFWRRQQRRGPKHRPGECAALRPHNAGGFACESCGGRFARCFGSYGARDAQGVWTPGSPTDLGSLPESPNGQWCCAPCEAVANNPQEYWATVKSEGNDEGTGGGGGGVSGEGHMLQHPFKVGEPRPFKAALYGGAFPFTLSSSGGHTSSSQVLHSPAPSGKKKDPNAPKQAKSAYLFFAEVAREEIKTEHPDADFIETGKLTGLKWKALSEEDKAPYNAQAAAARAAYAIAMAAYAPPPISSAAVTAPSNKPWVPVAMVGGRCRECPGCRSPDCGRCRFCLDKVRFGGPGALKHACADRKCSGTRAAAANHGPSSPTANHGLSNAAQAQAAAAAAAASASSLPGFETQSDTSGVGLVSPQLLAFSQQPFARLACAACRGQHKRHTCDPAERIPRTQAAAFAAAAATGGGGGGVVTDTYHFSASPPSRKKDPNAPKQAKSAYLFFAEVAREEIKTEHPDADFIETGKLTGLKWKALSEEDKAPYNAQAVAAKEAYAIAMSAYVPPTPPPAPSPPAPVESSSYSSMGGVDAGLASGEPAEGGSNKRKRASGAGIARLKDVLVQEFKARYEEEVASAQAAVLAGVAAPQPSSASPASPSIAEGSGEGEQDGNMVDDDDDDNGAAGGGEAEKEEAVGVGGNVGPADASSSSSSSRHSSLVVVRHRGMTVNEVLTRPVVALAVAEAGLSKPPMDITRDFLENKLDTRVVRAALDPPNPATLRAASQDASAVAAANAAALAASAMTMMTGGGEEQAADATPSTSSEDNQAEDIAMSGGADDDTSSSSSSSSSVVSPEESMGATPTAAAATAPSTSSEDNQAEDIAMSGGADDDTSSSSSVVSPEESMGATTTAAAATEADMPPSSSATAPSPRSFVSLLPPPPPPTSAYSPSSSCHQEPRYVFNPVGSDRRPNVSRQSLVKAVHCASGAKVFMRGSHVAYSLANAVAAHSYQSMGRKVPLAGSIQSSVHARLRRNAGDRADAYGFEWVAVLPQDEAEELGNNYNVAPAGGTGADAAPPPLRVLTTEAEGEAYGRALVAASSVGGEGRVLGTSAAAAATGSSAEQEDAVNRNNNGETQNLGSGGGEGGGSPTEEAGGGEGCMNGEGGVGGPAAGALFSFGAAVGFGGGVYGGAVRPSNNWKPWKCPEPGCTKAYTLERKCSKHPATLCFRAARSSEDGCGGGGGMDEGASLFSEVSHGAPPPPEQTQEQPPPLAVLGGVLAPAPAAVGTAAPQQSNASEVLGGFAGQPQSATPYSFVNANRVYVAL